MTSDKAIEILKALADRSRLSVINVILEKPAYVEEIAERLGLAKSTVSFHLKKLEAAGIVHSEREQYYTMYHPEVKIFDITLKELVSEGKTGKSAEEKRMEAYRDKVLKTYIKYGKLERIPSQHKKRIIILEEILKRFESGRTYTEKEVNLTISEFHDDFCTIRREFIERGMMSRKNGIYQVIPE